LQTRDHETAVAAVPAESAQRTSLLARANSPLTIWALIILLPLAGFGVARIFHKTAPSATVPGVTSIGSIAWPRTPGPQPSPTQPIATGAPIAPVDSLVSGLEQRLDLDPTDAKGWALLAQSYAFLGNRAQAESALAKAVALGLDETDLRQRIELASGSKKSGDPGNLSGGTVVIRGMVKLASTQPLELPSEARLFITAKSTDGSTLPVAVIGQPVAEFPYQFELSDRNAMMPGVKLSDFETVALSARVSLTGTAQRSAGDLESAVKVIKLGQPGLVDLVIENR